MTASTRAREVTDWFPAKVTPVHVGVYEAFMQVLTDRFGSYQLEFGFAKWDGNRWGALHSGIKSANEVIPWACASQAKAWRGLKAKV